jgi:hypothetical protein
MSYAETPVKTEIQQLLEQQAELIARQDRLVEAVNSTGEKVQWVIDRAQGIFEMFASPQMMAMLPSMMNGAMGAFPAGEENPE